jgi:hypothetical protein
MVSRLWRTLLVLHRYLGIAVGFMMLVWFGSGIVMMYVGYPELSAQDRLHSLLPIQWQVCCNLTEASFEDNQPFDRAVVESMLGTPVLRLARPPLPDKLIDLSTGRPMDAIGLHAAEAIARDAASRTLEQPARLIEAADIEGDPWTIGLDLREGELFRFIFDDPQRSFIYVSPSGRVVLRTTASERFWNWFGAIPHWLYLAPLRRDAWLWSRVVIWASIVGALLTVLGLCIGFIRLKYGKDGLQSPYRGLYLFHHLAGLIFGIVTLTWVVSGLVSMNPWGFLESRRGDERVRLQGAPPRWGEIKRSLSAMQSRSTNELSLSAAPLDGHLYWLSSAADGTVTRWDDAARAAPLAEVDLMAAAGRLAGKAAIKTQGMLDEDDDYYFSHDRHQATLPVYRVVLDDAEHTRYYLDAGSGALVQRVDANGRWHRWLFAALHRLDFAAWLRTRPLWDFIVQLLLLGGIGVSATGCYLAVRCVRADLARMLRRRPRLTLRVEIDVDRSASKRIDE